MATPTSEELQGINNYRDQHNVSSSSDETVNNSASSSNPGEFSTPLKPLVSAALASELGLLAIEDYVFEDDDMVRTTRISFKKL